MNDSVHVVVLSIAQREVAGRPWPVSEAGAVLTVAIVLVLRTYRWLHCHIQRHKHQFYGDAQHARLSNFHYGNHKILYF